MQLEISTEKYLVYHVQETLALAIVWLKGEGVSQNEWRSQLRSLKEAFHYFMLDLEVDEFSDLRLPSERKQEREETETKAGSTKGKRQAGSGALSKVLQKGKQLPLFFVQATKTALLYVVIGVERVVQRASEFEFTESSDFQNKWKE